VQLRSIRNKTERRPPISATRLWPRWSTLLAHPCSAARDASITSDKVATDLRVFCVPYFESVVNWFTVPFTPSLVPSGRVESTV
jgi:hypothetical protein